MHKKHKGAARRAGFTLIELLVVIGLIGVLAAGIGLSLRDGNPTAALRGGAGSGLDMWRAVGAPTLLPQGVYVVPPEGVATAGLTFEGSWSAARRSKGFLPAADDELTEREHSPTDYPYHPTKAFDGRKYLKFQPFNPLGTTNAAGTILVTTGRRTGPAEITLNNPDMLRGVFISRYGVPTLINEAATFDQVTIP